MEYNYEDLLHTIEVKREQMIQAAMTHGFSSVQAINLSQELDKILDIYQSLQCHKKRELVPTS